MSSLFLLGVVCGLGALGLAIRPNHSVGRGGTILGFLVLFALPTLVTGVNTSAHVEQSKSTSFCLSCHEMEPYGQSLLIDDGEYLPAVHYQNHLVDEDRACYTCHTSYAMYGDLQAKLKGLRHVWVHYLGTPPETLELYEPYNNRECLHCHRGARSFEDNEDHIDEAAALTSGGTSCLDCHDLVHGVDRIDEAELWRQDQP